jgi:hypothetical protein
MASKAGGLYQIAAMYQNTNWLVLFMMLKTKNHRQDNLGGLSLMSHYPPE